MFNAAKRPYRFPQSAPISRRKLNRPPRLRAILEILDARSHPA